MVVRALVDGGLGGDLKAHWAHQLLLQLLNLPRHELLQVVVCLWPAFGQVQLFAGVSKFLLNLLQLFRLVLDGESRGFLGHLLTACLTGDKDPPWNFPGGLEISRILEFTRGKIPGAAKSSGPWKFPGP